MREPSAPTVGARLLLLVLLFPLALGVAAGPRAAAQVAASGVPSLASTATGSVLVGGSLSDSAVLSGGVAPTGTLSFALFGPDDPLCLAAPLFGATVPVKGAGRYRSPPFTAGAPRLLVFSFYGPNDPACGAKPVSPRGP